ncbi:multi-sensor hybrid histidine kinase [Stylonychia lemnae]|uniref:Multi-sensor hybrid histidine kinase n=1 Tax=Stylonychia lemnae TaxID=5949 RepID=A0A078AS45_STYLE|nr:multi-sensor hybrid histidine kinase [Stylonychia lemnae]|eukprot:CDW84037.1 multi-sensor hybrid histidine kinase [Stylonychia lemnae]
MGTSCYIMDHKLYKSDSYQTSMRCYLYIAGLFSCSTIASKSWIQSTICFLITMINLTINLWRYFDNLPSDFYSTMVAISIIFSITVYIQELNSRKLFMMFREKQEMEEKSATILKLFPESLSIVNLKEREFVYYNEPFSHFYQNTLTEKSQVINDFESNFEPVKDSISIKIYNHGINNSKRTQLLEGQNIWGVLSYLKTRCCTGSTHIRLLTKDPNIKQSKVYFDVQQKPLFEGSDTYMFVFKNITILKELEQNRQSEKISKMAYYQMKKIINLFKYLTMQLIKCYEPQMNTKAYSNAKMPNMIKIDIEDTGPGIDKEMQSKLFKLFGNMRFKSQINQYGAGIGLTFNKKLCQIIGAQIGFKTMIGIGTTFTVVFNIDQQLTTQSQLLQGSNVEQNLQSTNQSRLSKISANQNRSRNDNSINAQLEEKKCQPNGGKITIRLKQPDGDIEEEKAQGSSSHFQTVDDIQFSRSLINNIKIEQEKKKILPPILIVDDANFNVYSLKMILKTMFGLESDFSYSGKDAIQMIKQRHLDTIIYPKSEQYRLIFMDLNMPDMNGQETTQKLKEMDEDGEINLFYTKFILYSCLSNTSDLPLLSAQFDDVASKPIQIDNLRILLQKHGLID